MTYNLWEFQNEDVSKLENEPSALLLWGMGLGKTLGAIERDKRLREARQPELGIRGLPTLIVAPLSTHEQWRDWLYRVHSLPNVVLFSQDREAALAQLASKRPGFYILHWELLRASNQKWWSARELYPVLIKTKFLHVIGDEIHRIKTKDTQVARVLKKINHDPKSPTGFFGYRTGLTGTPITNKPPDLWSILNWLKPKEYTSFWKFDNRYAIREPQYRGTVVYKEYVGPQNTQELQGRIASYIVMRRKEDVLPDLPDKYYTEIRVDLSPAQRRAYDSMRKNMVAWIGENEQDPLAATATVAKLQRLQQFAVAHAEIVRKPHRHRKSCQQNCAIEWEDDVELREPSSKLDVVMELLDASPEEEFVVFSQSKQGIKLLATRLSNVEISYSVFHGDLSKSTKRSELDKFVNGEARVFIATGQSGGEGIDGLQRAATLIRVDRGWSDSGKDQEEARLHRAGQKNAVHVIDIVARDTIDQLKDRRIFQKKNWASAVLDGLGG
jgi:SNF2 family DNA or RNA helicase